MIPNHFYRSFLFWKPEWILLGSKKWKTYVISYDWRKDLWINRKILVWHQNICWLSTRIFVVLRREYFLTELKNICCLEKMEKNFSSPIHDLKDSIRLVDRANKSIKRFPFLVVWMKAIIWKGKIPKHMIFWTRYKGKITRKKGAITKQI